MDGMHTIGEDHPSASLLQQHAYKLLALHMAIEGLREISIHLDTGIAVLGDRVIACKSEDRTGCIRLFLLTSAEATRLTETGQMPEGLD